MKFAPYVWTIKNHNSEKKNEMLYRFKMAELEKWRIAPSSEGTTK